jgi:curved DNA-binding protein CbpA
MTYYQILGVSQNAEVVEIRKAFRIKAKQCHPDVNDSPHARGEFQRINEAYQVLQDEEKRRQYDLRLINGFPVQTVHYRPGKVRYRAKGDKYAHYRTKSAAEKKFDVLNKIIDIVLFAVVFSLGSFSFLYGMYRLYIKRDENIDPFPGIIMGAFFIGILIIIWFNRKKFRDG